MRTHLLLFFIGCVTPLSAQQWPWFFTETVFQKWVAEKNVKCIRYVNKDIPYEDSLFKMLNFTVPKEITTYYFNESGILKFVRLEKIEITPKNNDLLTEETYNWILTKILPAMPLEMAQSDKELLKEYSQSKLFPGILYNFMDDAIAPNGTVFAERRFIENKNPAFPFYYWYHLNQEVYLENGEITELHQFDLSGDFWIPNMSITWYEPLNDSISILSEKGHITSFEEYTYVPKDTLFEYQYYRKISSDKSCMEYGARFLNPDNTYQYYPLKTIITHKTATKKVQLVTTASYGFRQEITPFLISDAEDWQYPGPSVYVPDDYWSAGASSYVRYTTKKYVSILDRKTGQTLEKKEYCLSEDKWEILATETKTQDGLLKNKFYKGRKNKNIRTLVSMDENGNPVFIEEYYNDKEILFRISGDSIYVPTSKIDAFDTYLIEYR